MPVYLVGAGPGDPELLTLKGKRVLESADAVLYDQLANPALLEFAPAGAERCYVGKRARHHAVSQNEITAWMIARARGGANVVRLKGGDPFIFGRGGEEIEALERAGVGWEVVPGVSAATGVSAAAGIPLTHRGLASGVRFVSGHAGLAAPGRETLVVFMGLERLDEIARDLVAQGWPRSTRAVVIERGTLPGQRAISAALPQIAARARRAGVRSPALVIVGEVVGWWRTLHRARSRRPAPAPGAPQTGLILMAHGSPLPGWQLGVDQLGRELALPGQFSRAAYLPPVRPGLGEAVAEAVARGVRRLAVVPYFLAAGLHVTRDLPALVAAERKRHPQLRIEVSACLEGHPALRTAVLARAEEVALCLRDGAEKPEAAMARPPRHPAGPAVGGRGRTRSGAKTGRKSA